MAALDAFLELEPMEVAGSASAPPCAAHQGANASAPPAFWAARKPAKQLQLDQQRAEQHEGYESDAEACTTSPGCSYSGDAAVAAAALELEDDACSALWHSSSQQQPQQQPAKRPRLPDGTALAAASLLDDLLAGGSVLQYCLQR